MKVAIITGGSRGLGKAMARDIAAKGHDVLLTYKSQRKEAEEVVDLIEKQGRKAVALQLDVSESLAAQNALPAHHNTSSSVASYGRDCSMR